MQTRLNNRPNNRKMPMINPLVYQIRWILVALILVGQEGIQMIRDLVQAVLEELGEDMFHHLPTILAGLQEIKECMGL